jgi:hypothetical protein
LTPSRSFHLGSPRPDRLQPGILIGAGLVVFCHAGWLTASAEINTSFWDLAVWTALIRLGLQDALRNSVAPSSRTRPDNAQLGLVLQRVGLIESAATLSRTGNTLQPLVPAHAGTQAITNVTAFSALKGKRSPFHLQALSRQDLWSRVRTSEVQLQRMFLATDRGQCGVRDGLDSRVRGNERG